MIVVVSLTCTIRITTTIIPAGTLAIILVPPVMFLPRIIITLLGITNKVIRVTLLINLILKTKVKLNTQTLILLTKTNGVNKPTALTIIKVMFIVIIGRTIPQTRIVTILKTIMITVKVVSTKTKISTVNIVKTKNNIIIKHNIEKRTGTKETIIEEKRKCTWMLSVMIADKTQLEERDSSAYNAMIMIIVKDAIMITLIMLTNTHSIISAEYSQNNLKYFTILLVMDAKLSLLSGLSLDVMSATILITAKSAMIETDHSISTTLIK
mmetsp:Transcript_27940/g.29119  ORF Transcript_27940/g.29119 Transcript_27940/m.29119 type:complete len:267 (+) Transcript_27940:228-1028(+)